MKFEKGKGDLRMKKERIGVVLTARGVNRPKNEKGKEEGRGKYAISTMEFMSGCWT